MKMNCEVYESTAGEVVPELAPMTSDIVPER